MADDQRRRGARRVIVRRQESAEQRPQPQHLEVPRRHGLAAESLGAVSEEGDDTDPRGADELLEGGHRGELLEFRNRQRDSGRDVRFVEPHAHEAVGVGKRQRTEEQRAHERRYRGCRRSAQRKAQHGCNR